MDEYINRKLITDSLEEIYNDIPVWEDDDDWNKGIKEGIWVAMSCINALPSAQPKRSHGKWIDEGQYADFFPHHAYRCSKCGYHLLEIEVIYDFCPHCGADMRGEQDD